MISLREKLKGCTPAHATVSYELPYTFIIGQVFIQKIKTFTAKSKKDTSKIHSNITLLLDPADNLLFVAFSNILFVIFDAFESQLVMTCSRKILAKHWLGAQKLRFVRD